MGELIFSIFYGSALILIGLFAKYMMNKFKNENERIERLHSEKNVAE
ncbi:hypothetical protein [Virgibacillus sediminis]|uniref:Uncharacterized protein n=1 Tax=Virgibacillus sediminis TaxID=202260 RepID=A0ABV7A4W1_9BACI